MPKLRRKPSDYMADEPFRLHFQLDETLREDERIHDYDDSPVILYAGEARLFRDLLAEKHGIKGARITADAEVDQINREQEFGRLKNNL